MSVRLKLRKSCEHPIELKRLVWFMATPAEIELPHSSGLFLVLCLMHSTLVIGNTKTNNQ